MFMNTHFNNKKSKLLTSILALTLILSTGAMAAPAYAAEISPRVGTTMEYGMSVEQSIQNIKNTVDYIKANLKNGSLVDSALIDLSNQLYALDTAIQSNGGTVSQDVKTLLGDVEATLAKVNSKNVTSAKIALAVVMANAGIDGTTVNQAQSNGNFDSSNIGLIVNPDTLAIRFTDVKETDWYYKYVMGCAQKGLVSGVGNNEFAPNKIMTRAEFLTVVVRYLYPDAIKNYNGEKSQWWSIYYNVALQEGLIKNTEFTEADMSVAMSRQEMALVISRALAELGETPDKIVSSSKIPDYAAIGSYYKDAVRVTYTAGIISGTDSSGTFSPMGTLTRGQACTVLYRLTEPQTRSPQTGTEGNTQTTQPDDNGYIAIDTSKNHNTSWGEDNRFTPGAIVQEWVEGQPHNEPRVGDVVIKADGTRVVLEAANVNGRNILGISPTTGPQGVDPYTGWKNNKLGDLSSWDAGRLLKDPLTESVFSSKEWSDIETATYPSYKGQKEGEISTNGWFSWDADMGSWEWIGPWS